MAASAPLKGFQGLFDPTEAQSELLCWGCDPSTLRVALAVAPAFEVSVRSFPRVSVERRLAVIYTATAELAAAALAKHGQPSAVWLELPGGKNVHPQSRYAVGAIAAALGNVSDRPVQLIAPASWKKLAVGHGGATKGQTLEWARGRGYPGRIEDEADALGIAVAGSLSSSIR